jgi:peptidoglycan/xylan/chitin deacetylase (PgdA/CDA1 family)
MKKCFRALTLLLLLWVASGACTGGFLPHQPTSEPINSAYAVIVTVARGDTLESLARTYLKDEGQAWRISAYNNVRTLIPGRQVVIPLQSISLGGLHPSGYQTVPILLYQDLAKTSGPSGKLSADTFEKQLNHLQAKGYSTCSLDDLHAFMNLKMPLPPLSVLICLDSTDSWVYESAYPLLKKKQMQAAVFIAPEEVNTENRMNWDQISQLALAGFSIGSRGLTGRSLARPKTGEATEAYLDRLDFEIKESRRIIEKKLKRSCQDFAYPDRQVSDLLIAILKKYGYRSAFTSRKGSNAFFVDPFKIHRNRVGTSWNPRRFQSNLSTYHLLESK